MVATYLGLLVSTLLTFYFGDEGVMNYNRLMAKKNALTENINGLKRINRELKEKMWMLKTDAETNRVEARRLGYISDNQVLIKLENYNDSDYYTIGSLLTVDEPSGSRNFIFKLIGLAFPVLFMLFYILRFFYRSIKD